MEREVQHDPQVLEGEDDVPRQPEDRATYEPAAPPRRARAALWVALAVVVVLVAVVLWAILS
jgi:ferric-dicitrate binding protein FerR (iron transport regulator)